MVVVNDLSKKSGSQSSVCAPCEPEASANKVAEAEKAAAEEAAAATGTAQAEGARTKRKADQPADDAGRAIEPAEEPYIEPPLSGGAASSSPGMKRPAEKPADDSERAQVPMDPTGGSPAVSYSSDIPEEVNDRKRQKLESRKTISGYLQTGGIWSKIRC